MTPSTCTVCGDAFTRSQAIRCDTCGRRIHEACAEYHASFDPRCGRERWIGAIER